MPSLPLLPSLPATHYLVPESYDRAVQIVVSHHVLTSDTNWWPHFNYTSLAKSPLLGDETYERQYITAR